MKIVVMGDTATHTSSSMIPARIRIQTNRKTTNDAARGNKRHEASCEKQGC
jgi:hypothetical protein